MSSGRAKPACRGSDYRAVTVLASATCCAAVRDSGDTIFLMRAAPRLPLTDCSMPDNCRCTFRKVADRRGNDRRLLGGAAINRWYNGSEHRVHSDRRDLELRLR